MFDRREVGPPRVSFVFDGKEDGPPRVAIMFDGRRMVQQVKFLNIT